MCEIGSQSAPGFSAPIETKRGLRLDPDAPRREEKGEASHVGRRGTDLFLLTSARMQLVYGGRRWDERMVYVPH